MNFTKSPKFKLGKIVITPGAISSLAKSNQLPSDFLTQHQEGNWGEHKKFDKKQNELAISNEGNIDLQQRVLSSYKTKLNEKIWIITEWDRSITTILLPDEY